MANIRTPKQKEKILKEYLNGKGIKKIEKEYNINNSVVYRWLEKYEKDGVIRGYKAIVDWDKIDREYVTAYIEVKVTPKRDQGFDEIAEKIMEFPEVESVTLMSGGYDLSAVVSGKSFKDIALFVAKKLSVMDSVLSTATHFALRRYKDGGISFVDKEVDERGINIL